MRSIKIGSLPNRLPSRDKNNTYDRNKPQTSDCYLSLSLGGFFLQMAKHILVNRIWDDKQSWGKVVGEVLG